ncbi:MAG: hypothetical protein P9M13_00045 [Candidatus Ancaeobacter aquaticus]|nr:hypothetical protein [Candidatus Ancaeobacter aquaticus]
MSVYDNIKNKVREYSERIPRFVRHHWGQGTLIVGTKQKIILLYTSFKYKYTIRMRLKGGNKILGFVVIFIIALPVGLLITELFRATGRSTPKSQLSQYERRMRYKKQDEINSLCPHSLPPKKCAICKDADNCK